MTLRNYRPNDTIIALATGEGKTAIGVIRVSGVRAFDCCSALFRGKDLRLQASHTTHFGTIRNADGGIVDEVLMTVFRAPHSFTGENTVEISCHGSTYILQEVLQLLLAQGARLAEAGEFTMRAFMNGKMDLSQAEAVADLIASESEGAHRLAVRQLRGGFSKQINALREQLIHFASLIELELDFAEEDVEFADRKALKQLLTTLLATIERLKSSFKLGNAIKNGVPVAIVGKPNAGKSTLLNTLLEEEKAIVSPIAGTTRDVVEDTLNINGICFRLMDTAGLRQTDDLVERIGVERTIAKMGQSSIILYLCSAASTPEMGEESLIEGETSALHYRQEYPDATVLLIANKSDLGNNSPSYTPKLPFIAISAKEKENIDALKQALYQSVAALRPADGEIVTNARHAAALHNAALALRSALSHLADNITADFIAMDIRQATFALASVVGAVSNDDILDNIFRNFCIGK